MRFEKLAFRPGLHRASTSGEIDFPLKSVINSDAMIELDSYADTGVREDKSSGLADQPTAKCSDEANCSAQKPQLLLNKCSSNSSLLISPNYYGEEEELIFPKSINWDWPFCLEGVARGAFLENKFFICLPFSNGGSGEMNGSTKKFENISESNYSWTVGLSGKSEFATNFWRMELEVMRNLNMLALIVSRDISVKDSLKKLKRVRKVYKLPDYYDIRTLKTKSYDWAIILEAEPRVKYRSGRPMQLLRRADTLT